MTKSVKNVVLVFTILCAFFLVFFSVELYMLNRSDDDERTGAAVSGGRQDDDTENGSDPDSDENDPSEDEEPPGDEGENGDSQEQDGPEGSPGGSRYELPMILEGLTLVLYADEEHFEHVHNEDADVFTYLDGGEASLFISYDFITPPGGINGLAGRFLQGYLDGGDSTVLGARQIGGSELRGVMVRGEKNGETYEAWIHSLTGSTTDGLAVVFVINFESEEQRDALYSILDTMVMVTDEDDEDDDEEI